MFCDKYVTVFIGVRDWIRTSIKRICNPAPNHSAHTHIFLENRQGFEPWTPRLKVGCSTN